MGNNTDKWQALITAKQQDRVSRIPTEWVLAPEILNQVHENGTRSAFEILREHELLTEAEVRLTESYDARALFSEIVQGKVTALEVCKAFCKRAAIAHQLTNCATEIFFDEALNRAQFLDEYLLKEKKPYGPFHGVPISVKDCFPIEGQATTIGFVSYLEKPLAAKNSPVIDVLLENGAVLYLKTNLPQTMLSMDSTNNVFGRTLNPHHPRLTAGGSSGGEGALIGLRGSILGVGTDIGGSIRAPSLCNGIYGFKPTADRIPHGEWESGMRPGAPGFASSAGPLATSATDLTYFCKSVILSEPWRKDSTALAGGWCNVQRKEKLRIGVFMGDGDYPLAPPVTRALKSATTALERAGHQVDVLSSFPSVHEALKIAARFMMLDNEQTLLKHVLAGDEQPIKSLAYTSPATVVEAREYTLKDVWDANAALIQYREKMAAVWRKHDLDIVLCPGARTPATPHDTFGMPVYTLIWNLLNARSFGTFPASIIPFLKVDASLDAADDYDPTLVNGLPTAVQVVGWRHQDEEALMATEVIDEALKRYQEI
ncbi:amidase [Penicillium capsulatum]|uniref:amidase n=1 Tax=Penicillium capsulatum TaxID=69766 RepID=A0A9W9LML2_9EURO|nr:amidase [Penicillium capsulatum]